MNLIIAASVIIYLLISLYFCNNWLKFSKSSVTPTPGNSFLSLIILVIIMISWPLAVPLYLITFLSSFIVKKVFPAKPKNAYFYQTVSPVTVTATTVCQGEKV